MCVTMSCEDGVAIFQKGDRLKNQDISGIFVMYGNILCEESPLQGRISPPTRVLRHTHPCTPPNLLCLPGAGKEGLAATLLIGSLPMGSTNNEEEKQQPLLRKAGRS